MYHKLNEKKIHFIKNNPSIHIHDLLIFNLPFDIFFCCSFLSVNQTFLMMAFCTNLAVRQNNSKLRIDCKIKWHPSGTIKFENCKCKANAKQLHKI